MFWLKQSPWIPTTILWTSCWQILLEVRTNGAEVYNDWWPTCWRLSVLLVNNTVTKDGSLSAADKDFLFRTVARNNSVFIDMISKIRIKDRNDTAWNLTEYEELHYGMKEEFELDRRMEIIESKLQFIHENSKFFLEVLQGQKNNSLEWIIVFLIALECGLMCVEMSGYGESMFAALLAMAS